MAGFREFVDKRTREARKQLATIKRILENGGFGVNDFTMDEDPYIFAKNPAGNLPFDGVRIYRIGDEIAYRVQKEEKTHPYGKAFGLDIEEMFNDLISDEGMTEQKAGKEVMKAVQEEIRQFFNKNAEAEKEFRAGDFDFGGDPSGHVTVSSSTGTDYSNTIQNTRTYSPL